VSLRGIRCHVCYRLPLQIELTLKADQMVVADSPAPFRGKDCGLRKTFAPLFETRQAEESVSGAPAPE
jgi:hypothetical protein